MAIAGGDRFLDGFCSPDMTLADFRNQLGKFTPCFTDVCVLGTVEAFALAVFLVQLTRTLSRSPPVRHRLTGVAARVQIFAAALVTAGLLIPLLQLNARLGEASAAGALPASVHLAPYEWMGFGLSTGRWMALLALLLRELQAPGHVILPGRWLVRFALVLGASAELVKARLLMGSAGLGPQESGSSPRGYFYYLYGTYLMVQLGLAGLALTWRPGPAQGLLEVVEDEGGGEDSYQYRPLASSGPSEACMGRSVPCPETTADWVSHFTFGWMSPLIRKGHRTPLTAEDIWALHPGDRTERLAEEFSRLWRDEQVGPRGPRGASLAAVCWRMTSAQVLAALPYKLVNDAAQFVGPLFLNMMLQALASGAPSWRGYLAAGLMFCGSAAGVLADNQHFQAVMRAGFRVKAVLSAAVHRQIFRLTPAARSTFSSGRVYSLAASDVETLQALFQNILSLVSCPVRILVAVVLLYRELGPASLAAAAVLVAVVPLNAALVGASNAALQRALAYTDERTKLEAEMIGGIMVVKCSAWEAPLQERIEVARKRELVQLWRVSVLSSVVTTLLLALPVLIPVATFGLFLALGNELEAAKAFTCMVLFNVLRFPLFVLPQLVGQLSAARVSLGRLRDFLAAEAMDAAPPLPPAEPGQTAVRMVGDFGWDPRRPPSLVDVDLDVRAGQLVVIVGSTGSGKSTLLSAALGQAQQVCGAPPRVAGRLAYVPQSPFVTNATIRENILFGLPYDEARYQAALEGACLREDLAALPAGDLTELGDRGVNVSGGQKQRIALARALFSDPDVALLDDPLSALDAAVGRRVFQEGIMRGLLAGRRRTVLLATNQLYFVRQADLVVVLDREGGRMAEVGAPAELLAAGGAFAALMRKELQAELHQQDAKDQTGHPGPAAAEVGVAGGVDSGAAEALAQALSSLTPGNNGPGQAQQSGAKQAPVSAAPTAAPTAAVAATTAAPAVGRLTEDEKSSEGALALSTLAAYLGAMPMPGSPAGAALWLVSGFSAAEALRVATTAWLAHWTEKEGSSGAERSPLWYLGVYSVLSAVQLLVQAASTLDSSRLGLGAAAELHSSLLTRLLGAPLAFFHSTPLGRIVNRLTKDTADIDRNLAATAAMAVRTALQLVSTLALVAAVAPFALPALVIIMLAFYWLYQYFQASVRQIKRLDAVARSPVMSSLSEALSGTATYIAYGVQGRAARSHSSLLDTVTAMSLVNQSMNRWLSVRLEILGSAAALLAGVVSVEQRVGAGPAGLVMSYALQVTTAVSITIRAASMAEAMLNSVERVVEYCQLDQEGAPQPPAAAAPTAGGLRGTADVRSSSGGNKSGAVAAQPLPPDWPPAGQVEFRDVQMRYRPGLPLVLHGVSFKAAPRAKVGVVGRTGAGKSSLLSCLFRLVEVERGAVLIDDVNIAKLPLRELRARLSLIPQSPVLFTGQIRTNLSPFGRHSDAELWGALRRAHLAPLVESWPAGLDTELAEGGAPLSAGQKQLLALARALLNPAKVLVLDEATANVDVETDALIQSTLRSEFPDRTLLTIAHRLATIIDYDRILLLDGGRVLEYDTPAALLGCPGSSFGGLVDETGEASARVLRQMAAGDGNLVQTMLAAPARAALDRLTSIGPSGASRLASSISRLPSILLLRQPSVLQDHTAGTSGLGRSTGHLLGHPGPETREEDLLLPPPVQECWQGNREALAALGEHGSEGGAPLATLASLVAGRSSAVMRMVQELREELDLQQQQLRQQGGLEAAGVGGMGADAMGLMLAGVGATSAGRARGMSAEDRRAEGEGSGTGLDALSLAATRQTLNRCLMLLEEARLGAVALRQSWAATATQTGMGSLGDNATPHLSDGIRTAALAERQTTYEA